MGCTAPMDEEEERKLLATPTWDDVQAVLLSPAEPVTNRYRMLFWARQVAPTTEDAAVLLAKALPVQQDSVLMRHEAAYVLGQLGETATSNAGLVRPLLKQILRDEAEDEVVRHEAVEALAALDDTDAIAELEEVHAKSSSVPLQQTIELAVAGLKKQAGREAGDKLPVCVCQYTSKDPAQGKLGATEADVPAAATGLADTSLPLYERYEALFTLRNVGGEAAAAALGRILTEDVSSAVLRHEVAFVLAQMENDSTVSALKASLAREDEHGMVRHEAAIALGSIGGESAEAALHAYKEHVDPIVAESCQVALRTAAYWKAWEAREARIKAQSA
eukprot:TRINITY_DN38254_c0_g1_i1.p2 TRINITY_DN38254_c0_g1~~TRINITY_DN38254_c0_g1_i1.p2  ORF type:complete len:333 (-),score=103.58 TRINITY_DN38254_c0_g1_i1:118-1116(-)